MRVPLRGAFTSPFLSASAAFVLSVYFVLPRVISNSFAAFAFKVLTSSAVSAIIFSLFAIMPGSFASLSRISSLSVLNLLRKDFSPFNLSSASIFSSSKGLPEAIAFASLAES